MPSMSKPQGRSEGPSFGPDTNRLPRRPKCGRCRNHDLLVPIKGHAGKCPFYLCQCSKCALISERNRIMAVERNLKRKQQTVQPLERVVRLHNSGAFGGLRDEECMSISSHPNHLFTILDSGGGKVDTGQQPGASSLLLGVSEREQAKVLYTQYPCLQAGSVCHTPTWNISGRPPFLEELTVPLSLPSLQGHVLPYATYPTQDIQTTFGQTLKDFRPSLPSTAFWNPSFTQRPGAGSAIATGNEVLSQQLDSRRTLAAYNSRHT